MGDDLCQGIAVAQQDPPFDATDPRLGVAVDAWNIGDQALGRLTKSRTSATDGRYKYLQTGAGGRPSTSPPIRWKSGPLRLSGLGEEASAIVNRLRQAAISAGPATSRAALARVTTPSDESEDIEARMRLLGYM